MECGVELDSHGPGGTLFKLNVKTKCVFPSVLDFQVANQT